MMCVCMSIRKREEREGEGDEGVEAGQQGWRRSLVAAGAMVIFWVVFSFSSEVVGCVLGGEGGFGGRIVTRRMKLFLDQSAMAVI